MANLPAAALLSRQGDREALQRLAYSTSVQEGLAQRTRIVLLAVEGISNTEIVWRTRYDETGIAGLTDHDR